MDYSKIKFDFKIGKIDAKDLFLQENFESLKYAAYNLMEDLEWDEMILFAGSLAKKLSEISPQDAVQKRMFLILRHWVLRLELFAFGSLKDSEKNELFKKNFIEMLTQGLDIEKAVFDYLDIYDSPTIVTRETSHLLFLLNANQELLGNGQAFSSVQFKPTVENWIKEYQTVLRPSAGMKLEPGAFHIVKFMDSNQYVKYLTSVEKSALRELLDFYNSLLNPITYVAEGEKIETPYVSVEKFELPQSMISNSSQAPIAPTPPKAPLPPRQPVVKPMQEVQRPVIIPDKPKVQTPGFTMPSRPIQPVKSAEGGSQQVGTFNRLNIQDLLKSRSQMDEGIGGLTIGGGKLADSSQHIADRKPETKTPDIDKKLEELRKKTGSKQ